MENAALVSEPAEKVEPYVSGFQHTQESVNDFKINK